MFVSNMLKKCANLINNNEFGKDNKEDENDTKGQDVYSATTLTKEDPNLTIAHHRDKCDLQLNADPLHDINFKTSASNHNNDALSLQNHSADREKSNFNVERIVDAKCETIYDSKYIFDDHMAVRGSISIESELKNMEQNSIPDNYTIDAQEVKITKAKPRPSVLLCFDPLYITSEIDEDINNCSIANLAEHILNVIIEEAINIIENTQSVQPVAFASIAENMAEISDKLLFQEEENAELKLKLNASQQVQAAMELQLRQQEEIIIKSQTEALRKDQAYKQEIKQLKEKLEIKSLECDNTPMKELQDTIKLLKAQEAKLLSEVNVRKNEELNYRKLVDEHQKTLTALCMEQQKLKEEHETVKRHFANLELAFSDVHQKYERSKQIIDGYKCNEETLKQTLLTSEDTAVKSDEKYESLKAHAKAQIEKSNQELQLLRDQYDSEIHKLTAIIRRLEIKNISLVESLDQKTKECSALSNLCDEVTGKV